MHPKFGTSTFVVDYTSFYKLWKRKTENVFAFLPFRSFNTYYTVKRALDCLDVCIFDADLKQWRTRQKQYLIKAHNGKTQFTHIKKIKPKFAVLVSA